MHKKSLYGPVGAVVIAMFSIQSGAALAKQLFPYVGAIGTTTYRLSFAALILTLIWRPWRQRLTRAEVYAVLGYGASLGLMNILFYLSLDYIPLGLAVAIEFTGPLVVAILGSRQTLDLVWAALAAFGIVLLLPLGSGAASLHPLGVLYALGAALGWGLYIVFGQRAGSSLSGGRATSLGLLTAALLIAPLGAAATGAKLFDLSLVPHAFGVAISSSALPYSLEMIALKKLPAKSFGILMSLEPAIAALLGGLLLQEHLNPIQWLAMACIMGASLGCVLSSRPQATAA